VLAGASLPNYLASDRSAAHDFVPLTVMEYRMAYRLFQDGLDGLAKTGDAS
jgi:hypothetical protein